MRALNILVSNVLRGGISMNVIEINNLTKDFGNNKGVFNLSFTLKQGEIVGFLGSNGAGKTTTIRHLMGFIKPENGSAKILNMDCFENANSVQEKIGYLPGEIAFMDNMTGNEFIQFMANMKNIRDLHYAKELISYFDIDTKVKIKKMSKGMKQKIGIIIAFMQDTPILVLDEPTTGLDPLMQNKFVELIKTEKSKGKTILMSSHIFEEIENTCERIIMIKDGRLVADENINAIRSEMSKHYEITFSNIEDAISFQELHTHNSNRKGKVVYLLSKGNVNTLISELHKFDLEDINARYQTLEEVFMKYYGGNRK